MSAPRLVADLAALTHNARHLVALLAPRGVAVTGVTKAFLGAPALAEAMLAGGVSGLGDSRCENLVRLREAGTTAPLTLIRSPMLSQAAQVVKSATTSLNTEPVVLRALSEAASASGTVHDVLLMVELGDLREGIPAHRLLDVARHTSALPGLRLVGVGTNLACRSGVVPDQLKMDDLSSLAEQVEKAVGHRLTTISGGNSANLDWALVTSDTGRVNDLRLGEAILLGIEPLRRTPVAGLRNDAFVLRAEVIEVQTKPSLPWGVIAQGAFGVVAADPWAHAGSVNQVILALGRQDVDPDGLLLPEGLRLLGASSDHLVLDAGDVALRVGDEVAFGLDYAALLRAMTSPYVELTTTPGPRPGSG
ncbi:alanine/ornithine racemase family PLP-dependent enzyme [Nocardioides gilvus]|uniref:alanine/ornithine racemase family PLP-dependent enzyme n=1 Tax=Nocardioides gilvus TaxID=1735589 RepID=UPI000D75072A|nr:alanine/ornithine racemase family PLP-dependent enzyme [Nocardioides gilvus]